jgi:hypothetical protein
MPDGRSLNKQHLRQILKSCADCNTSSLIKKQEPFLITYVLTFVACLLACRAWLVSGKEVSDASDAVLCRLSVASRRGGGFSCVSENRRMLPGILLYGLWLNWICLNKIPVWRSDHVPILLATWNINQHPHAQSRLINTGTLWERTRHWFTVGFNTLRTKLYLSDMNTQFVPRSKHSLPRL